MSAGAGVLDLEIRSSGLQEAKTGLADLGRAGDTTQSVLEKLAQTATRTDGAAERLSQSTTKTGAAIAATGRAANEGAQSIDRMRDAAGRFTSTTTVADRLAQGFDKATKAAKDFEAAAGRAAGAGVTTPGEPSAPLSPRPGNDNRRGLDSRDKLFLQYQAFDAFSQASSGASLATVGIQQGTQSIQFLADREGGLKAGLADVGASALKLATPVNLAAAAVLGLGAAFVTAAVSAGSDQRRLQEATLGLGRATGQTATSLDAYARSNAEAGKVSTSTAREMVAAYNSAGDISSTVYGTLIASTQRYADLTRQDVPAATAELARAFSNPAQGADELAARIGGLDDKTRVLIQTQQEQGDRTAAQETLAAALKAQIDANAAATTGWAAAWNTVTTAADRAWESLKRAAGAATGLAPLSAQTTVDRLNERITNANQIRAATGKEPLGLGDSLIRERDTAALIADGERRKVEAAAAEARADKASATAGKIARSLDPREAQLSDLRTKRSDLSAALDDPLARGKLADVTATEQARDAYTRAIDTMTDANGKLISSSERARLADELRRDSIKATTAEEKAAVAERQKAFDLAGQPLTRLDAGGQITRAGTLAKLEADSKEGGGGSKGEKRDDFDRVLKSTEDRIRRQQEDVTTYGMGAEAAAKYRTETELLTAAKRAERDVTPELSAKIQDYARQAGEAAGTQEKLRESMRDMDGLRSGARDVTGGLFKDFNRGASAADAMANAVGRIRDRITDLATDSIVDGLFGKRGSSGGLLSSLFGIGSTAGATGAGTGEMFLFGEVLE